MTQFLCYHHVANIPKLRSHTTQIKVLLLLLFCVFFPINRPAKKSLITKAMLTGLQGDSRPEEDGQSEVFIPAWDTTLMIPFLPPSPPPDRSPMPLVLCQHAAARPWPRATPSSQQGSRSSGNSASSWWHSADFRAFLGVTSDAGKSLRDNQPAWRRAAQIRGSLEEAAVRACEARCFRAQLANDAQQVIETGMATPRTCSQCLSTAKTLCKALPRRRSGRKNRCW